MSSPYTTTRRKKFTSTKDFKWLRRIFLFTAMGISCAAVSQLNNSLKSEEKLATEIIFPNGTLDELTAPPNFTKAYLAVNCDANLLLETQSILAKGHILNGGKRYGFSLVKMRPNRILVTVEDQTHKTTYGANGDNAWQRVQRPKFEDVFSRPKAKNIHPWIEQRNFFDRIVSTTLGEGRIIGIKQGSWKEADCLKVNIQNSDGDIVEILVSPETMYPIAEFQTKEDGSIKMRVFSDYRIIDGMPLAFKTESFSDGEVDSVIILDNASLNTGVLSSIFEIPEPLLKNRLN